MAPHGGRCQKHPTLGWQQTVGSRHAVQQTGSKGFDSKGDKGGKATGKRLEGQTPLPYYMPARETWFACPGDKGKGKSKGKDKGRIVAPSEGPRMLKLLLGLHYKCPTFWHAAFRILFRRWFYPISFTDSSEYEEEELASPF